MEVIKPSKIFERVAKKHYLYNICPLSNVSSIMKYGLLSYEQAKAFNHSDISLDTAQSKRSNVFVTNGMALHKYVNLYFDSHNPMLSRRRRFNEEICVLVLEPTVLDIEGTIVTDSNAASPYVIFYEANKLDQLDFDTIYMVDWRDDNPIINSRNKARKCAEVLVPNSITYDHIVGAIVVNDKVKELLLNMGFDKRIEVDKTYRMFFKGGY